MEDNLIEQCGEGRYITVFLVSFSKFERRNFRCVNCGKLLFVYDSDIDFIIDSGDCPKKKGKLEVLCTRCRLTYKVLW